MPCCLREKFVLLLTIPMLSSKCIYCFFVFKFQTLSSYVLFVSMRWFSKNAVLKIAKSAILLQNSNSRLDSKIQNTYKQNVHKKKCHRLNRDLFNHVPVFWTTLTIIWRVRWFSKIQLPCEGGTHHKNHPVLRNEWCDKFTA